MTAIDDFRRAQTRILHRYGVDAESLFPRVAVVNGRAHVLRAGHGPAVVLVPGFADPAAMWTPLLAQLAGFTVYAVDRPCFGLTDSAEHDTATIRRLAADFLSQVLDALGLARPLVIGNSIGSLWATWLALDRPDRVAAMVHIGCPALWLGTSAPLPMRLLSVPSIGRRVMASPPSPSQVEAFGRLMAGEDLSLLPELRDLLVAAGRLPGAQRATVQVLHALVRLRGARPEVTVGPEQLQAIRQPVLLVWGSRDKFGGPDVGREAARVIPDASLRVVACGGHVPWVGHPAEVAGAAVPFLRDHAV